MKKFYLILAALIVLAYVVTPGDSEVILEKP